MKFSKSKFVSILFLGLSLGFSAAALADGESFQSGHFCQEMGTGQQSFRSSNGSMRVVKSQSQITCPISVGRNPDRNLHVIVNYTANGPTMRILCRIVRTNFRGEFDKGEQRGARDKRFGQFELSASTNLGGGGIVAANLECTMTRGATIIGYSAFFRD